MIDVAWPCEVLTNGDILVEVEAQGVRGERSEERGCDQ